MREVLKLAKIGTVTFGSGYAMLRITKGYSENMVGLPMRTFLLARLDGAKVDLIKKSAIIDELIDYVFVKIRFFNIFFILNRILTAS